MITFDGPVTLVPNFLQEYIAAVHLIGLSEGRSVKLQMEIAEE